MLVIRPRRWPHRLYFLGWSIAFVACAVAVWIGINSGEMSTNAIAGGIGLFIVGLTLIAVLLSAGLDRRWPRRRYRSIEADENGLTITRRGREGSRHTLKWEDIESVEVDRRPFVTEVRVIGAGEDRGKSLKLTSLAWSGLDDLVQETLERSSARLVEGRRGRTGGEYS